jgi:hypothetical protein
MIQVPVVASTQFNNYQLLPKTRYFLSHTHKSIYACGNLRTSDVVSVGETGMHTKSPNTIKTFTLKVLNMWIYN